MTLPSTTTPTRLSTDFVFVFVAPWVTSTVENASDVVDWGNPLPNVIGHNSSEDANDEEWRHYGTGPQTELDTIEYPVSLSLEASTDLSELGVLLGYSVHTNLNLANSSKVHIAQAGFTAGGTIIEVEYWSAVQWTSLGSSASAGTSVTYKGYELSGKAEDKYVISTPLTYRLTVTIVGDGTVTTADGNIDCESDCTYDYAAGASIELTAVNGTDTFSAWSEDMSGSTNPDSITMSADRDVTATFT